MNTLEENPFQEESIQGFDSKDIILDLMCGICYEITVQAQECVQCGQIFCEKCVNDYKKKQNKCATCLAANWQLKKPNKIYINILSRLQFKCQSPGCINKYTIDNYKSHVHRYPTANEIMYDFIILSEQGIKTELDQSLVKQLEKRYQNNQIKFHHYVQNQIYSFDFSNHNALKAFKCSNNETCTVIRKQYSEPQTLIKYVWVWYNDDSKKWMQYTPEQTQKINQFYESFLENPDQNYKLIITFNNLNYELDMQALTQTNTTTKFKRSIYRSPVFNKQRFIQS
ncbi:hypothetical protein ABPG74_008976 [Tetrahymena malaccensis]